ncbi:MAG: hypothetical protein WCD37_14505, partial [Chloroflexia bacterium]
MKRLLKWALPVLVIANVALLASGVLDARAALAVGFALEAAIAVIVVYNLMVGVRRYRRDRAAGLDVERALEEGLEVFVPRRVARLVALEPRLWYYLARWLFRRRDLREGEYGYNKRSMMGALVAMLVVSAPVELLLAELLIPWPVVKWVVGIAAVYGALWLAGVVVSMRVLPHRLEGDGLRINYGVLASGFVAYENIEAVESGRFRLPEGAGEGLVVPRGREVAYIGAGGRADVAIRLREPVRLKRLVTDTGPVRTIYLAADDGAGLAEALRERIG